MNNIAYSFILVEIVINNIYKLCMCAVYLCMDCGFLDYLYATEYVLGKIFTACNS